MQQVMDNALRDFSTSNYEIEFCTKFDETRHLLVNATTRCDDETIIGVVGVAQDVTETKKHDREVASIANELRQLINTANVEVDLTKYRKTVQRTRLELQKKTERTRTY